MKTFFGRHYGWAMVTGAFLYLMVTWGIVFNANSIFLVPIEASLGIGRAQTMVAITIRGIAMSAGAFAAGPLYSRFSFMRVWQISGLLLVASYTAIAFVQSAFQYYLLSGLHIFFITIAGFIPVTMMINRWFHGKTGSAMGLALMGSAAGGMLFSPVAGWLIPRLGWRAVNLGFGGLMFLLVAGMTFFFFHGDPREKGLSPYGRDEEGPETQVIRPEPKPLGGVIFVLISLGIILMNANLNVLITNTAPYLQAVEMSIEKASLVTSVIMFSMGFGKIALGVLYDLIGMRNASLLTTAAFLLGYMGLLYYDVPVLVWLSALGTGFGSAFNSLAPPIFARALYGVSQFTKINALFQAIGAIGVVAAPLVVGLLYERTGSYSPIFQIFLISVAVTFFVWIISLPGSRDMAEETDAAA